MTISYGFDISTEKRRSVVTIGSFDGVHSGHRVLIDHLRAMAKRLDAESVVVTFDPHPRIAMGRAEGMGLLTTIEERAMLLAEAGVDHLVVAHFDEAFRSQPYEVFVRQSLVAKLGMVGMIVGYNHRLGSGSEGNYDRLLPLASECGFEIERVEQHLADEHKVSSTEVRKAIVEGDMSLSAKLLGRRYMVCGRAEKGVVVVEDEHKLLPKEGCYAVELKCNETMKPATVAISDRRLMVDAPMSGDVALYF